MTELGFLEGVHSDTDLANQAKSLLTKMLLPSRITHKVIQRYIRKALRNGVWRTLSREARALLLLSSRILIEVKSQLLSVILKEIFIEIELHTFRGKALFIGLILTLKKTITQASEVLQNVSKVLYLGISYLNTLTICRANE